MRLFALAAFLALIVPTFAQQLLSLSRHPSLIRPGDQVEIRYRVTPEYNQVVTVPEDGIVILDTTGSIKIAGLTVEAAAALVIKRSSSFLNDPVVTVSLKDSEKPYFVVAGEVDKPGKYELRNPVTALQAILVAGGMTSAARSGQVIVYHIINDTDAEVTVLNLRTIKSRKGLKRDIALDQGDMVLVPRSRFTEVERVVKLRQHRHLLQSTWSLLDLRSHECWNGVWLTRPGKLSQNPLEISPADPTRKSKPKVHWRFSACDPTRLI